MGSSPYSKERYQKNKAIFRIRNLEYRRSHPEKIAEYNRRYREKYKDRELERKARLFKSPKSKAWFKQYRLKNKEKCNAQYLANEAVKNGKIKLKTKCEFCGEKKFLHKHHEDYSKPLDVTFLCCSCHNLVHRLQNGASAPGY